MNHITFPKVKLLSGQRILGLIVLVAGTASMLSPLFLGDPFADNRPLYTGMGFALAGIILSGFSNGTDIDLDSKRYRKYSSFLGVKRGEWMNIPALDGIYVVSHTEITTRPPNDISPVMNGPVTDFYVMAIGDSPEPVFGHGYRSERKAQEMAERLSKGLGAPLK